MYDLCGLGELLVDFTPAGLAASGNVLFERNPGGSVANVMAAAAKLGLKTAFMGKVGNDQFGFFLKDVLGNLKVDTTGLRFSDQVPTTLAFVHLDEKGDRSFSFYRNPGADIVYATEDIDYNLIKNSRVLHVSSLSLTNEPARTATLQALQFAKNNGVQVSYDPNLRPPLWKNLTEAKKQLSSVLKYADILKLSHEELEFILGEVSLEEGTLELMNRGVLLIAVTLGPQGCFYRRGEICGYIPTYDIQVEDTTGAGDSFLGALLYRLCGCGKDVRGLSKPEIETMIDFANAAGALTTNQKGAIPALPTLTEVERCQKNGTKLKESGGLGENIKRIY
jgi:fructokinase